MRGAFAVLLLVLAGCMEPGDSNEPTNNALSLSCNDPCERPLDDGPMWSFEPDVAVDPTDPMHVVVVSSDFERSDDLDSRWLYVHESSDGGATWTRERFPAAPQGDMDHPLAGCVVMFDPLATFLLDGTLVVAAVASGPRPLFALPSAGLVVATLTSAGADWGITAIVYFMETSQVVDQPCLTTAAPMDYPNCDIGNNCPARVTPFPGLMDKPFLTTSSKGLHLSYATDATRLAESPDGKSWAWLPEPQSDVDPEEYSLDLAVLPDGVLCGTATKSVPSQTPAYQDVAAGCWDGDSLRLRVLDKQGVAYPRIEAGRDGRLWLAYPRISGSDPPGASVQTPVLRFSDDLGMTWSEPLPLDDADQPGWIVPTLAVDGNGIAYSGFYHHLEDGTNEYRIAASDGMQVARVRVDASPIGTQGLGLHLGHYMGIAGLPDGAVATWVSGDPGAGDLRAAVVRATSN